MRLNNKGHIHLCIILPKLIASVSKGSTIFHGAFLVGFLFWTPIVTMAVWHIPAWEKAKDAHCEAAYQSGNMKCGYK